MDDIYQLNLKENKREVIPYPSPKISVRAYHGRLFEYPNKIVPAHWHNDWEFILVEAGNALYHVNGREFPMGAGDGLFVNSNRLHSGASMNGGDFIYSVLQLHPALLSENPYITRQYLNPLICAESLDALFLSRSTHWQAKMLEKLEKLSTLNLTCPEYYELESMSAIYSLVEDLYQNVVSQQDEKGAGAANVGALMNMLSYIQEHFSEKISLRDIAGAGVMCQSKCCNLFKSLLHQSPFSYLQSFRIQKSLPLLSNSQMSVTDVASVCGFGGASYFIEVFHRSVGTTPKEFRRSLAAESGAEYDTCTLTVGGSAVGDTSG